MDTYTQKYPIIKIITCISEKAYHAEKGGIISRLRQQEMSLLCTTHSALFGYHSAQVMYNLPF